MYLLHFERCSQSLPRVPSTNFPHSNWMCLCYPCAHRCFVFSSNLCHTLDTDSPSAFETRNRNWLNVFYVDGLSINKANLPEPSFPDVLDRISFPVYVSRHIDASVPNRHYSPNRRPTHFPNSNRLEIRTMNPAVHVPESHVYRHHFVDHSLANCVSSHHKRKENTICLV